ncbi:MAG TPA: amino acid permease [Hyphomicrobiaceae bacterium]|nr:amino acid permease [Hyphomicrobiaceae bacterium]
MQQQVKGVTYEKVDDAYFQARGLRRHAGVWSLWALGVGAVISGEFSGWNLGLASGGWGGMLVATILIAIMYLGLTYSLAEMSPAMPHTGGAYSFARTAFGPWGGFLTGLSENVEYVMTAAVIVFFIGTYLAAIVGAPAEWQPVFWILGYMVFAGLNYTGVELSFRISLIVTFLAVLCLLVFFVSAIPHIEFGRWALNIAPDGTELPEGNGPMFPMGVTGVLAALPFAVWLFLAIEQLPLAAEESVDPKRDMPKGIMLGMFTLIVLAFLVLFLNPSVAGVGSHKLGASGEPLLDGLRAIYGTELANILALVAVTGLVASFHAIIFAFGRQIYSLSRAGYFPRGLSVTHGTRKTPHVALFVGALVGLAVMLAVWFIQGADQGAKVIGGTLLNMAVFGAMFSYVAQGLTYIQLKRKFPNMDRPYKSPIGVLGAWATVIIALITIYMQLQDPTYRAGVLWVAAWFAVGIAYFALVGRHKLILSPEEEFALAHGKGEYKSH